MRALLITILLFGYVTIKAQTLPEQAAIYESVESPVYEILQELAAGKFISYDGVTLPLTRVEISQFLQKAKESDDLSKRLEHDVDLFLRDFGFESSAPSIKIGFESLTFEPTGANLWYDNVKAENFHFRLAPYLSGSSINNGEETLLQRGVGLSFFSYLGKNLALYARLNDKGTTADYLGPQYLSEKVGGNLKPNQTFFGKTSWDYSELNGGITYSWDWGHVGLVKERIQWGSNQFGANILSGRAPSNVMIDLQLKPSKWFSFKYIHAWLVSEVIDSTRTYLIPGGQRQVFTNKNLAANMFTLGPWKDLKFSFGNSIIYADNGIEPIYLIPLFFFKSADHNNSGAGSNQLGQNAQLFGNISYSKINGALLYSSLFVDEVNIGSILDSEAHTNLFSWKFGFRLNGNSFAKNSNLALKVEYIRTNPWTYRHQIPSTTFASNDYGLGHYLGENAEEWSAAVEYRPIRGLKVELSHRLAYKGADHVYALIQGNANVTGLDFLAPTFWSQTRSALSVDYSLMSNVRLHLSAEKSSVEGDADRLHPFFNGERTIVQIGFRLGL